MSTIIRATDQNRGVHGVAFHLGDVAAQADQYLEKTRAEAAQIMAKAQQEADAVQKRAEQEGYAAAMRAVEEFVRKELATVLPAMRKVIEDVQHAKQAWMTHWEAAAVHTAAAIAGRLVRRELAQQPEIGLTLLREALELAAGNAQLRVHVNPADHKAMGAQIEILVDELGTLADAEIVANDEITLGGCRVETQFGIIDQQFETQIQRIEEELTQ